MENIQHGPWKICAFACTCEKVLPVLGRFGKPHYCLVRFNYSARKWTRKGVIMHSTCESELLRVYAPKILRMT